MKFFSNIFLFCIFALAWSCKPKGTGDSAVKDGLWKQDGDEPSRMEICQKGLAESLYMTRFPDPKFIHEFYELVNLVVPSGYLQQDLEKQNVHDNQKKKRLMELAKQQLNIDDLESDVQNSFAKYLAVPQKMGNPYGTTTSGYDPSAAPQGNYVETPASVGGIGGANLAGNGVKSSVEPINNQANDNCYGGGCGYTMPKPRFGDYAWSTEVQKVFDSAIKAKFGTTESQKLRMVWAALGPAKEICSRVAAFTKERNIEDHWETKLVDHQLVEVLDVGLQFVCPKIGLEEKVACDKYFHSIFTILSPHGSIEKGKFEHGVLDFYFSKIVFLDPKFDQHFVRLETGVKNLLPGMTFFESFSMNAAFPDDEPINTPVSGTNQYPLPSYPTTEAYAKLNLWEQVLKATNNDPISAMRLLTMIAHDSLPYSYQSIQQRLAGDGQYKRAALYVNLLNRGIVSNYGITSLWLPNEASVPALSSITAKKYHGIAGAGVACELMQLGYKKYLAVLGSAMVGAAYETIDITTDHLPRSWDKLVNNQSANSYGNPPSTIPYPPNDQVKPERAVFNVGTFKEWMTRSKQFLLDVKADTMDSYRDIRSHYIGAKWGGSVCERR